MTIWNYLSTEENRDVASEEILNVLRRSGEVVMGTTEIADAIGMSTPGAKNRLEELEDQDRVVSRKIGGNWVWGLHPSERQEPIPPEIDRLVRAFDRIRETLQVTKFTGGVVLLAGFALMFAGFTGIVASTSIDVVSNEWLIARGYAVAGSGGAVWLCGGIIIYGTIVVEQVATWRVPRYETEDSSDNLSPEDHTRGQVDLRIIFALLVLVIIAGPVLQAAGNLQSGLAESPAFSPIAAFLIATLFVAAIAASVLEAGR